MNKLQIKQLQNEINIKTLETWRVGELREKLELDREN